jgi:hypothetical protein
MELLQALEVRAEKPQPQTIEIIEYHVLKALPEKAYMFFNQKVRAATDKPTEEKAARTAFFLALRNFALSNKPNVGTDENHTQMLAQSAAMEHLICSICGQDNQPPCRIVLPPRFPTWIMHRWPYQAQGLAVQSNCG